jgi:CRP-like cAMP-binding protein
MKQFEYNAGDIILKEGGANDVVYKIASGDVEVFKEHDGQTIVLGMMKAGEFLAEMGIVDDKPLSVSARAKNKVSIITYEEHEFFRLISQDGSSAKRMIISLCERVRSLIRDLAEAKVSLKTTAAIGDEPPLGEFQRLRAPACTKCETPRVRLIVSPLSEQLISYLPKEGMTVTKLPDPRIAST